MYVAVIRKDNRIWRTVVLRNKLDEGVIVVEGEKIVVKLHTVVGNKLIYDVDELATFEVWLEGLGVPDSGSLDFENPPKLEIIKGDTEYDWDNSSEVEIEFVDATMSIPSTDWHKKNIEKQVRKRLGLRPVGKDSKASVNDDGSLKLTGTWKMTLGRRIELAFKRCWKLGR